LLVDLAAPIGDEGIVACFFFVESKKKMKQWVKAEGERERGGGEEVGLQTCGIVLCI